MKKKWINIVNNLNGIRAQVKNSFTEEGQKAAQMFRDLLDELENSEVEVDEETLIAKVKEIIEAAAPSEKVVEEIENRIANRLKAVNNAMNKELPTAVKNRVCAAILNSAKGETAKNVEKVLVENGISGLSFADVIDYKIVEKWGSDDELFNKLHRTFFSKFFYNTDTMPKKQLMAHGWVKSTEADKIIQELSVTGKTISTQYVYKRQKFAFEDLDDIARAGQESAFLSWLNEELDRIIVKTIIYAILRGDTTNDDGSKITTFESIANKTAGDAFTKIVNPASAGTVTLKDLRQMADDIHVNNNEEKVLCIRQSTLTAIEEFVYASGGTISYRTNEEMAKMIGVGSIYVTDYMDATDSDAAFAPYAVIFVPSEYWVLEKNVIDVTYPHYERNAQCFQKERNIGGKIHGLASSAVLRKAAAVVAGGE